MSTPDRADAVAEKIDASRHPEQTYQILRCYAEATRVAPRAYVLDIPFHSADPTARTYLREAIEDLLEALRDPAKSPKVTHRIIEDAAAGSVTLRAIRHTWAPKPEAPPPRS